MSAYLMLQEYGQKALTVPSATGWEQWTSEEQRSSELYTWFKDILPKSTDKAAVTEEDGEIGSDDEATENN